MRGTGLEGGVSACFQKQGLVLFFPFVPKFSGHQVSSAESRPENCGSHSEGKKSRNFTQEFVHASSPSRAACLYGLPAQQAANGRDE